MPSFGASRRMLRPKKEPVVETLGYGYGEEGKSQMEMPAAKETVPEPVVETAPETVVETVPEPVVETVSEPVVETAPETVSEPVVETVSEPVVETAPKKKNSKKKKLDD
jgi:outer membrane biosynthesis protein TonB